MRENNACKRPAIYCQETSGEAEGSSETLELNNTILPVLPMRPCFVFQDLRITHKSSILTPKRGRKPVAL